MKLTIPRRPCGNGIGCTPETCMGAKILHAETRNLFDKGVKPPDTKASFGYKINHFNRFVRTCGHHDLFASVVQAARRVRNIRFR